MSNKNQIIERIKYFFIKLISVKLIVWLGIITVLLFFSFFMELYFEIIFIGWLIVSGMCFAARTTEKLLTKYIEKDKVI